MALPTACHPGDHCPGRLLTGGRHVDLRPGDGASPFLRILGPECGPAATTPRAPRLATCPALSADSSSATIPARLPGPPGTPWAGAPRRPVRGEGGDGGLACGSRRVCRMKPEVGEVLPGCAGQQTGGHPAGNAAHWASGPPVTRLAGAGGRAARLQVLVAPEPGLRRPCPFSLNLGTLGAQRPAPPPSSGLGAAGVTLGATLLPAAPPGDTLPGPGWPFSPSASPTQRHNGPEAAGRAGLVIREECGRTVSQGRAAGAAPTRPSKPPNCLQLLAWLSCQGPAWVRGLHAGGRPAPSSGNGALQTARVNGPRSGPPWPAQVQPFPGQAALGRAETLRQAGGGGSLCGSRVVG